MPVMYACLAFTSLAYSYLCSEYAYFEWGEVMVLIKKKTKN